MSHPSKEVANSKSQLRRHKAKNELVLAFTDVLTMLLSVIHHPQSESRAPPRHARKSARALTHYLHARAQCARGRKSTSSCAVLFHSYVTASIQPDRKATTPKWITLYRVPAACSSLFPRSRENTSITMSQVVFWKDANPNRMNWQLCKAGLMANDLRRRANHLLGQSLGPAKPYIVSLSPWACLVVGLNFCIDILLPLVRILKA